MKRLTKLSKTTTGAVTAIATTAKRIIAANTNTATTAIAAATNDTAINAVAKNIKSTLSMMNLAMVISVTLLFVKNFAM